MPGPSYGRSRDRNESDIVKAFRRLLWLVVRHDEYDLDVCCPSRRHVLAVEVKMPKVAGRAGRSKGSLTKRQHALVESGWPLHVVYGVQDALDVIERHTSLEHSWRAERTQALAVDAAIARANYDRDGSEDGDPSNPLRTGERR